MPMDPNVRKLLDDQLDVTTLSDDALARLQSAITREFNKLDSTDPSEDNLTTMEALADCARVAGDETTARTTASADRAAKAATLRSRVLGDDNAGDTAALDNQATPPAPDADGGDGGGRTDDAAGTDDASTTNTKAKAVAASSAPATTSPRVPTRADLAKHRAGLPTGHGGDADAVVAGGALVASADMMGLGHGEAISWKQLSSSMARKIDSLGRGSAEDQHLCASLVWEYPEERKLGDDAWGNYDRLNEFFAVDKIMDETKAMGGMSAVVAAGGVCQPTPVDYNVPVDSVATRPVRDAIPSFQATRGGLRFITPPTFGGVGTNATTVWTAANDALGTPTTPAAKPVQTFACPSATEEFVDAIPTRLQFSNFQARFAPEVVAANTQLALANAARLAEQNLLSKLSARSTIIGAPSVVGSFARDLFALLEVLAQGYRMRNRLPDMFPLRFMAPMWAKGALRTDVLRELAHSGGGTEEDPLAVADERINNLFAVRGIIPNWTIDGLGRSVANSALSATGYDWPDQFFAAPAMSSMLSGAPVPSAANSAVAGTWFPTRLSFFLFAEGTFVFLDGGRIDLGLIRDSVLNATNQYQTFVEPFEGIAKRGYESIQCTVPCGQSLTGNSIAGIAAPAPSALAY